MASRMRVCARAHLHTTNITTPTQCCESGFAPTPVSIYPWIRIHDVRNGTKKFKKWRLNGFSWSFHVLHKGHKEIHRVFIALFLPYNICLHPCRDSAKVPHLVNVSPQQRYLHRYRIKCWKVHIYIKEFYVWGFNGKVFKLRYDMWLFWHKVGPEARDQCCGSGMSIPDPGSVSA